MKFSDFSLRRWLAERQVSPKGLAVWLIAAAVLLSAAFGLQNTATKTGRTFPVYITEILASNTCSPNRDGLCCDFIELYNGADYPIDLTGFQLGDIAGSIRYAFPAGTVMEPGSYLAVYCDKTATDGNYAAFEISRGGGENFYLIADNKAIADHVVTVPMDVDQSMILDENGQWGLSKIATPGAANVLSISGLQEIWNSNLSAVRISEFTAENTGYLYSHSQRCDWVELHNTGNTSVDMSGFTLSDNAGNDKYVFPQGTVLEADRRLVVNCTDRVAAIDVAPFGLSLEREEMLVLKNNKGLMIQVIRTNPMNGNTMALCADNTWTATAEPSPGYENTAAGYETYVRSIGAMEGAVRIREVMCAGQSVLPNADGDFPDWVELHNTTSQPINLAGWSLTDDPAELDKWLFPELILEPDGRAIVFCSGKDTLAENQICADFALSSGGESLTLTSYLGNTVDSVNIPASQSGWSVTFDGNEPTQTQLATPGYPNDESGYEAFCASHIPTGPIAIWEVMSANDWFLPQNLGECYDWVELRNVSDQPIDLSGYSLADDPADAGVYPLSGVVLQPGQCLVIILSSEPGVARSGYQQLLFNLDAKEDSLFLFDPEGTLLDYVIIRDVPTLCSYGRTEGQGGFTYMEPSPKNPNTAGQRMISSMPVSSYAPGVYTGEGFTVDLQAAGQVYYTTDGSTPTVNSALYSEPITVDQSTVLRAMALEEGKWVSDIYTATFVVGEEHDLPVVSLVTDPEGLWGPSGVYRNGDISVKEVRLPANVAYSGSDGSFSMDCEMNLHGATTVTAFDKKTFAVRFQDYLDGPLLYDVFEDGEVTAFRSLIIRTAHENVYSSQMHDVLMADVAQRSGSTVLYQKYKYVALYLNGDYWGLYAIRERHSPEHYAAYQDVPADTVETVRFMSDADNTLHDLYNFCAYNSLKDPENYAYAKSILDVESFADWIIFQAYVSNLDIYGNIRYYYSPVDGLWRVALADLDLGMMGFHDAFDKLANTFHHGRVVSALMANEEFQHLLATRLAELLEGALSDENMVAAIHSIADTIRPEAAWEEQRWGTPVSGWESCVNYMIRFCEGRGEEMIDSLCWQLNFSQEQREQYFGHLE